MLRAVFDVSAEQAPTPVVFIEAAVQCHSELQHRPLQGQLQLLALDVTAARGRQHTKLRITGLDPAAFKVEAPALGFIQAGIQREVLQMVIGKGHLLALQGDFTLRCLKRTRHVNPALNLATQFWPQLSQTRQVQIKLRLDLLLQAGGAINPVITQANVQSAHGPGVALTGGFGLKHRRLATQAPFEVEVGVQFELFIFELAGAAQRARQGARQFSHPIRRVDRAQVQRRIPRYAIGKLHIDVAPGFALPRHQFQLRHEDFFEVTTERAADAEGARRPGQVGLEVAQVLAVGIRHFAIERAQIHVWLGNDRVQVVPGEVQPVDLGLGTQT